MLSMGGKQSPGGPGQSHLHVMIPSNSARNLIDGRCEHPPGFDARLARRVEPQQIHRDAADDGQGGGRWSGCRRRSRCARVTDLHRTVRPDTSKADLPPPGEHARPARSATPLAPSLLGLSAVAIHAAFWIASSLSPSNDEISITFDCTRTQSFLIAKDTTMEYRLSAQTAYEFLRQFDDKSLRALCKL